MDQVARGDECGFEENLRGTRPALEHSSARGAESVDPERAATEFDPGRWRDAVKRRDDRGHDQDAQWLDDREEPCGDHATCGYEGVAGRQDRPMDLYGREACLSPKPKAQSPSNHFQFRVFRP